MADKDISVSTLEGIGRRCDGYQVQGYFLRWELLGTGLRLTALRGSEQTTRFIGYREIVQMRNPDYVLESMEQHAMRALKGD